jgi:FKBP-type peptidyl-prolyl cis-trans isomerase SlyD
MLAQIISFNCILRSETGKEISSTHNCEVLTHFEDGQPGILSGLARGLQNVKKGEKRFVTVLAEEGYGVYDPKKVILYPRNKLSKTLKVDEFIKIISKTGVERCYRVLELHADLVTLDGNHPMSGKDLIFEIDTLEARDATQEEITGSKNIIATQKLH